MQVPSLLKVLDAKRAIHLYLSPGAGCFTMIEGTGGVFREATRSSLELLAIAHGYPNSALSPNRNESQLSPLTLTTWTYSDVVF